MQANRRLIALSVEQIEDISFRLAHDVSESLTYALWSEQAFETYKRVRKRKRLTLGEYSKLRLSEIVDAVRNTGFDSVERKDVRPKVLLIANLAEDVSGKRFMFDVLLQRPGAMFYIDHAGWQNMDTETAGIYGAYTKPNMVYLFVGRRSLAFVMDEEALTESFRDLLLHEVTHGLDLAIDKRRPIQLKKWEQPLYLEVPEEIRAIARELATEVLELMRERVSPFSSPQKKRAAFDGAIEQSHVWQRISTRVRDKRKLNLYLQYTYDEALSQGLI